MTPHPLIRAALRTVKKQRKHSMTDIAEACGIARTNLSSFLTGKRELPDDSIAELANWLSKHKYLTTGRNDTPPAINANMDPVAIAGQSMADTATILQNMGIDYDVRLKVALGWIEYMDRTMIPLAKKHRPS